MSSSSALSSDSEDDRKKPVPSSDSDDSGPKKNKKRPNRGPIKAAIIESDGSDSGDDSDVASSSRKRKAPPKKTTSKKKRGRGSGSDSADDHLPNSDLHLTAEDRKRMAGMSEKEREQEVFNRMEEEEQRKIREQIKQKLAAQQGNDKKKGGSDSDVSDSDRSAKKSSESESESENEKRPAKKRGKSPKTGAGSDSDFDTEFQRPSEMVKKKQQKSALSDLLSKRKEKEKKEAKKAALVVDAVFGKNKGSDDSDSSSSSDSASSRSSSRLSSPSSRARSASPDEEAPKKEVETRQELARARLSRFRMAKFVHAPFFRKSVVGCFVRVGGLAPSVHSKSTSKIAQIVDVIETAKTYKVEDQRTNKGLKLRIGGKEEKVIRLEFISNQDFNEVEFNEWVTNMRHNSLSLPTMDQIEKKEKDIKEASSHTYTDAEVESIVKEKKRFEQKTGNFAARKRALLTEKERAEQAGDMSGVRRLQREIQEVDEEAEKLDRRRQGENILGVTWINKRNRKTMKDALLGDQKVVDITMHDDPFTRKSGKSRPVCGKEKKAAEAAAALAAASTPATPSGSIPKSSLSTPVGFNTPNLKSTPRNGHDLFAMHNVDIDLNDLDLGLLKGTSAASSDPREKEIMSAPRPNHDPSRRPLSLEDYRRRRESMPANSAN